MRVVGVDSSSASTYQFDRMQQVRLALSSCGLGHVAYQSDRPDRYLVLRLAELFECRTGPVWPTSWSIALLDECYPRWLFTSNRLVKLADPLSKLVAKPLFERFAPRMKGLKSHLEWSSDEDD